MDFKEKVKLYIELSRKKEVLEEQINEIRQELLPYIEPGGIVTVGMKSVKRMCMERSYFDKSRFKQDYPALHDQYIRKVPQDYLRIVEASEKKSKRNDI